MHIKSVKISNFRALEDIYVELDSRVSVIVGPNAAGKTTVLEAVRLLKAVLAPRMQTEAIQVLQALGAASPHMPNRLRLEAIARDPTKDIIIGVRFTFTDSEIALLQQNLESLARGLVQSQLGQNFPAPDALLAYLSSHEGRATLDSARLAAKAALEKVAASRNCALEIKLSKQHGINSPSDAGDVQLVAYLERRLPPYKTSFSYFPADRALPIGEQGVQLGGPDAQQQQDSYNSQPQLKFNRLKNTIFAASIIGEEATSADALKTQFQGIFEGILKGRELVGFGINEIGLLTVLIKDVETGHIFDLDGMSSGEKGLILTFLLIARTIIQDGIVLFDEPELHLNPAVCKDLLAYIIESFVRPKNIQIIICSHSPEILSGVFDNEDCSLYHLISKTTLTKVRPQDEITLGGALRRLGASESENLLYKGIIFVEGPDDVTLLEAGFPSVLRRYRLKYSTGRKEIEKAIGLLQAQEGKGIVAQPTYFIFDRDDTSTSLKSSTSARVLQWDRRCLENYLIDLDSIANLLMDDDVARIPYANVGEVSRMVRELAFQQLDEVAARKVYLRSQYISLGIRRDEILNRSLPEIAGALVTRIVQAKRQMESVDESSWVRDFIEETGKVRQQEEAIWESNWYKNCDGKRLIDDIWQTAKLRVPVKKFKIRLMKEIALNKTESWGIIEGNLKNLLAD